MRKNFAGMKPTFLSFVFFISGRTQSSQVTRQSHIKRCTFTDTDESPRGPPNSPYDAAIYTSQRGQLWGSGSRFTGCHARSGAEEEFCLRIDHQTSKRDLFSKACNFPTRFTSARLIVVVRGYSTVELFMPKSLLCCGCIC